MKTVYQHTVHFSTLHSLERFISYAQLPGTLTDTTQDEQNGVFLANFWDDVEWGQTEIAEIHEFTDVTSVELNQPVQLAE